MTPFQSGDRLRYGTFEPGSAGCLLRFPKFSDRVLMLTAGHTVLPTFARQGDAITADGSNDIIGRLFTWTRIDGDPTTDAALVWVDPSKVSLQPRGLPQPRGFHTKPAKGDRVRIVPKPGEGAPREAFIASVDQDVDVLVMGPGWPDAPRVTYRSQIVTDRQISEGGDSGTMVLDSHDRIVGMVVAGGPDFGTIITPIAPILANAAWGGLRLELVDEISDSAVAPPGGTAVAMPEGGSADLVLSWLKEQQRVVAEEVCERLAAGGLGRLQLAAALANAMGESSLNPDEHNTNNEDSVGLFQLNRKGGAGAGRTVEDLKRIEVQCDIVLNAVRRLPDFMEAASLEQAVDVFVRKFERPANPTGAVEKRIVFARKFAGE